jgi:hypothetical protein
LITKTGKKMAAFIAKQMVGNQLKSVKGRIIIIINYIQLVEDNEYKNQYHYNYQVTKQCCHFLNKHVFCWTSNIREPGWLNELGS